MSPRIQLFLMEHFKKVTQATGKQLFLGRQMIKECKEAWRFMCIVMLQRWGFIILGFSSTLIGWMCVQGHTCVFVWTWTVVLAGLFVLVRSKQAAQECAFLCLNNVMWNHEIIPGASIFPFPLSPFLYLNCTSVFICGVCGLGASASALAYVQTCCVQVCFTARF